MTKSDFLQAKGFIYSDIQREIDLAENKKDAGNFLCALALLCYTEFGGGIKRNLFRTGEAGNNFNSFFDDLGKSYAEFRKDHDVYNIFRCGLAHEYHVKKNCAIAMVKGAENIGIYFDNSRYFFVVERYFEDFKNAFDKLETFCS